MNWKRGIKRITLLISILVALGVGLLSFIGVFDEFLYQNGQHEKLQSEYENILHSYKGNILTLEEEIEKEENAIEKKLLENKFAEVETIGELLEVAEAKKWIENNKNTPTSLLILYSILAGLVGGAISFLLVWLVFYLLRWLALGFCEDKKND